MIVLKGGREPFRGSRCAAVDQHRHGPASEEGIRVGFICHLALDRADAADRALIQETIGEKDRRMEGICTQPRRSSTMARAPSFSSCRARLRSS